MKKIRILHVLGNTGRGGSQGYAMNVVRYLDKISFEIDFAVYEEKQNGYSDEMRSLGSDIFIVPKFNGLNYYKCVKRWTEILDQRSYDIIHGHATNAAFIYLKIARKKGIKTIIHSHSAGFRGNWVQQIIKALISSYGPQYADYWFACSIKAAKKLYKNKYLRNPHFYLIPNAIDVSKYRFSKERREQIRQKYNIRKDTKVIGHLGSFSLPKNHGFLIDVFNIIHKKYPDSLLLLCGDGPLEDEIKKHIKDCELENFVIMTGNIPDVADHLMAMDIMVFPSIFEGLPVSLVEAQATGLPVIKSDSITNEVNITDIILSKSLNDGFEKWCDTILSMYVTDRPYYNEIVGETDYNITRSIHVLQEHYTNILK